MAANETLHARVQEAFRLSPLLWEAQSAALAESQVRCQGLSHFAYPSTHPMMIRPCFRVDIPQSLDLETSLVFKDSAEDTDFFADLSEEAADGTTIA